MKSYLPTKTVLTDRKRCPKCREFKDRKEFLKGNSNVYCKECYRTYKRDYYKRDSVKKNIFISDLRRKYDLSIDEYNHILRKQNNSCRICAKKDSKILQVHQCRITGKVRGLLCSFCKSVLKKINNDVLLLNEFIKYISNF